MYWPKMKMMLKSNFTFGPKTMVQFCPKPTRKRKMCRSFSVENEIELR